MGLSWVSHSTLIYTSELILCSTICVHSATRHNIHKANNDQLITSFKEQLNDTAGQIKRTNDTSAELPMKEIKELKFQEPLKFKRKANEDQYKFNLKLAETFDSAKSAAEKTNLEKVKTDLEECEKLLV